MAGIGIGISDCFTSKFSWSSYWATLISATVENAAPTHVVLTFPTAQTSLVATDFTIAGFTVSSASWTGAVLTLVLSTAVKVFHGNLAITFCKTGGTAIVTNNVVDDGHTIAWYANEAATITKDASERVAKWADKLGSGHDLLQTENDYKPIWSATGLTFDGSNDRLRTEAIAGLDQPTTIYMVVKPITWGTPRIIFDGIGISTGSLYQHGSTPLVKATAGTATAGVDGFIVGTYHIVRLIFNGANSKLQIDDNDAVTGNFGANNMGGITLGCYGDGIQYPSNIQVEEAIFRDVDDSAGDEAIIYDYLKKKKNNMIFRDYCDGTTIDATKWESINENPTYVAISQSNALTLDTTNYGGVPAGYFTNGFKSIGGVSRGIFSFSFLLIPPPDGVDYFRWGLITDTNNLIEFFTYDATNIGFRIFSGGVSVYEVDNVAKDFAQVKIVVDDEDNISMYMWENDAWVQKGVTFQCAMGVKNVCAYSRGDAFAQLSIRDVYITREDRATLYPEIRTNIATDARTFNAVADGSTDTAARINAALVAGNVLLQNGTFAISSSILIPSNRTLYVKNAKIRLNDGSFDNMFRNADLVAGNTGVNVVGLGCAAMDGNAEGNDSVDYSVYGGWNMTATELYKANLFFCGRLDTFEITGISFLDRQAFLGALMFASNGVIHDIYINYYHLTQNQDGIQCNVGTHDIEMYNLKGWTGDDFVSIFLGTKVFQPFGYNYSGNYLLGDVYNINYHDLWAYSCVHGLILITGDGNKIYNVVYDDVIIEYCQYGCYFGPMSWAFNTAHPTKEDMTAITMDNITVNFSQEALIKFFDNCSDITITNLVNNTVRDDYSTESGDQSDNVTINGVQVV